MLLATIKRQITFQRDSLSFMGIYYLDFDDTYTAAQVDAFASELKELRYINIKVRTVVTLP